MGALPSEYRLATCSITASMPMVCCVVSTGHRWRTAEQSGLGSTEAVTTPGMILAALFAVVTLVILPGVFLGYASLYRISRQEFFRACGQNLCALFASRFVCHRCGIAAGILHGIFHALAKLADASSYEKLPSMFT